MEIKLIRKYYQAKYTIGRLYVNDRFFSDCLEPPSLHLTERSALGTILIAKYKGYRAIPHRALSHPHHTQPTVRTMAAATAEREGI